MTGQTDRFTRGLGGGPLRSVEQVNRDLQSRTPCHPSNVERVDRPGRSPVPTCYGGSADRGAASSGARPVYRTRDPAKQTDTLGECSKDGTKTHCLRPSKAVGAPDQSDRLVQAGLVPGTMVQVGAAVGCLFVDLVTGPPDKVT